MKNLELVSPSILSASARAAEISGILAAGIIRMLGENTEITRNSKNNAKQSAVGLGFSPNQSVHGTSYQPEKFS